MNNSQDRTQKAFDTSIISSIAKISGVILTIVAAIFIRSRYSKK